MDPLMTQIKKFFDPLLVLLQSIIVSLAFLTFSPAIIPVPHRDSGIFLFIGSQILKGKVLYQQTWDNKQPLLYVLNALGLWLGKGSAWGVWAVELILFLAAFTGLYFLIHKKTSRLNSFLFSLAVFLTIYQIMSGNFSEEYAVCFQTGILILFFLVYLSTQSKTSRNLSAFGMGLLGGISFGLKQTYIDVFVAVGLLLLFLAILKKEKHYLLDLVWMVTGFLVINLVIMIYFACHNALNDYIVNAFLLNKYYSSQGLLEWIQALTKAVLFGKNYPLLGLAELIWAFGFIYVLVKLYPFVVQKIRRPLFKWGFLILGLLGLGVFAESQFTGRESGIGLLQKLLMVCSILLLLVSLILFMTRKTTSEENRSLRNVLLEKDWQTPGSAPLFFLGLVDLPLVLLTISLSGMNFNHYFISLLPSAFLLPFALITFLNESQPMQKFSPGLAWLVPLVMAVICASPLLEVASRLQSPGSMDDRAQTAAYLQSVTTPDQKILMWGWEAGIYFMADRQPPTRYSFQFPAYFKSPYQTEVIQTLLRDLKSDPPVYLADTSDPDLPLIPGHDLPGCLKNNPADGDPFHELAHYICSNVTYVKSIGSINIYRWID